MIPKCGPSLFSVPGFAWTTGAAEVRFRFPRNLFITGVMVLTGDGDPATLANVNLAIQDETFQSVISDGTQPASIPGVALRGIDGKPFPLQRPVMSGDIWIINCSGNIGEDPVTLGGLFLYFEEPEDN